MDFIIDLAVKYPIIATIVIIIGSLRIVFKPIMSAIKNYTDQTESKADDEALAKFEGSKFYNGLVWFLDFAGSIKLKK